MKAQRFTVTIKPNREGVEAFTQADIEWALRSAFPNVLNEDHGTHTYAVKAAK